MRMARQVMRVLNSDIYAELKKLGYEAHIPYPVADLICAIRGATVDQVMGKEMDKDKDIPTVMFLLHLGYGGVFMQLVEWTQIGRAHV